MTASGREYSLATGGFREADFQWLLSGDEVEERIDATRPTRVVHLSPKRPFNRPGGTSFA